MLYLRWTPEMMLMILILSQMKMKVTVNSFLYSCTFYTVHLLLEIYKVLFYSGQEWSNKFNFDCLSLLLKPLWNQYILLSVLYRKYLPFINFLNIPFKATVDIQEPDQSTAGIVDQTGNLWNKYENWYNETFLEQNST